MDGEPLAPATAKAGLVRAVLLDGAGGGRLVDWPEIERWTPADGLLWVHLDRSTPEAWRWVQAQERLSPSVRDALLLEGSRPRVVPHGDGVLVILRGINHNPGKEPSDMVSLRIWAEERMVISLRVDRMVTPQRVAEALLEGRGAKDVAGLLGDLVRLTTEGMIPVVDEIEEQVADLEERIVADETQGLRAELSGLRREAIALRRYLGPQRDALRLLATEDIPWIDRTRRMHVLENADRLTRLVEDLDSTRDRAVVASEELTSRLSEQLNSRMYVIAVVTAVFMPLSLLTGLLGINVGGIPGAELPWAFALVCGLLVLLAMLQVWYLRRRRWM